MIKRVLIIGGYGNFGRYISSQLALEDNLQLIIAGRNPSKGFELVETLNAVNKPEVVKLDIYHGLQASLNTIQPDIVIHTSGPFQSQPYVVAEACIELGCHYLDLADAREFVSGMSILNEQAKQKNVLIVTGASSVPALTCAIIDEYKDEFERLTEVDSALTTAHVTSEGLAMVTAILSYVGKSFPVMKGGESTRSYGWQGFRLKRFWRLNTRALGDCNIPDFDILPDRYPGITTVRFQAGTEFKSHQLALWLLSFLVRFRLIDSLAPLAAFMMKLSKPFGLMSSGNSGYFLEMTGTDHDGKKQQKRFDLIARKQHGQHIPCMPSIILTKKLAADEIQQRGASACVGMVSLDEYLQAMSKFDIEYKATILNNI